MAEETGTETPAETTPETTPPPPPPTEDASDLREAVTALTETVSGIVQRLEQITPSVPGDETPTSRPWTHASFK